MARSTTPASFRSEDQMVEQHNAGPHSQMLSLQNELDEKIRESRLAAEVGFALLQKNRQLQDQCFILQEEILFQSRIIREKEGQLENLRTENNQLFDKLNRNDALLAQTEDIRISQNQAILKMGFRIQKLEKECEQISELRRENVALLSELNEQRDQSMALFAKFNLIREQNKNHTRTIEMQKEVNWT